MFLYGSLDLDLSMIQVPRFLLGTITMYLLWFLNVVSRWYCLFVMLGGLLLLYLDWLRCTEVSKLSRDSSMCGLALSNSYYPDRQSFGL